MTLLSIHGLNVRYDRAEVLRDVALTVAEGEIVGLVGASGSGKSTLALAVPGLLPSGADVEGEIALWGENMVGGDERRLAEMRGGQVGMVLQEPATALNPALTIGHQIEEALARHTDLGRSARRSEVAALLGRVGLAVPPGRHPHALSGGQRQRVAIAMAIAAGPSLLIADEPTASLDPLAQQGIVELLVGLVRERRMGLLLISHDLALVGRVADRLVVIDQGRVAEQGRTDELMASPRSPFLIGAVRAAERLAAAPATVPRSETMVRVENVGRSYRSGGLFGAERVTALDGVSLTLSRGETLAVVGASGSGKSTLARLVLGLEDPDRGRIVVGGDSWAQAKSGRARALRRRVQAVFQDPGASFDPRWTVERIVAEPLQLLDPVPSAAEQRTLVADALLQVGLDETAASPLPRQFSGGQKQRIAIARALVIRPAVVVLDEPLTALDPALKADMVSLLRTLQDELGLAYLLVSHDLASVRGLAHRTLVLRDGRIVEEGETRALFADPRDPYTRTLVAAALNPAG